MKVRKSTIEYLLPLLRKSVETIGIDKVKAAYKTHKECTAFNIWNFVFCRVAYDDDHPVNANGRLFPHNPDFNLYPDGTNDDTLKTALVYMLDKIL